ncbi:MAG: hypothetical protein JWO56_621 [Acidobacteria bacterium]|nr:hypothetical protein [Acidobacteriota bacterium]
MKHDENGTAASIRAALLLTLILAAGCSLQDARESAVRLAAGALRRSVFCLQSGVPLAQSSFKTSMIAPNGTSTIVPDETTYETANAAAIALPARSVRAPRAIDAATKVAATDVAATDVAATSACAADIRIVTCPIEQRRLLAGLLLRTL